MPLYEPALNTMADALADSITELSLHSSDPGSTGANETNASRVVPSFTAASGGDFDLASPAAFTGGTPSAACTHVGLWDGATFVGSAALTGDQTFNAAGEYTVETLLINGANA